LFGLDKPGTVSQNEQPEKGKPKKVETSYNTQNTDEMHFSKQTY